MFVILKQGYSSQKNDHSVVYLLPCRTFQRWSGICVQTDYTGNVASWMLGGAVQ